MEEQRTNISRLVSGGVCRFQSSGTSKNWNCLEARNTDRCRMRSDREFEEERAIGVRWDLLSGWEEDMKSWREEKLGLSGGEANRRNRGRTAPLFFFTFTLGPFMRPVFLRESLFFPFLLPMLLRHSSGTLPTFFLAGLFGQ